MSKSKLFAVALLMGLAGACDSVDRATDCVDICNRYKDCINDDYDVKACSDRCNDMDSKDDTKQIDICETCLDGESCTGSVFNCTTECVGIVP